MELVSGSFESRKPQTSAEYRTSWPRVELSCYHNRKRVVWGWWLRVWGRWIMTAEARLTQGSTWTKSQMGLLARGWWMDSLLQTLCTLIFPHLGSLLFILGDDPEFPLWTWVPGSRFWDSEMSIQEIYWGGLLGTTSVRAWRKQRWAYHNVVATEAQLILRAALRLEWPISMSQLKAREQVFLSLQDSGTGGELLPWEDSPEETSRDPQVSALLERMGWVLIQHRVCGQHPTTPTVSSSLMQNGHCPRSSKLPPKMRSLSFPLSQLFLFWSSPHPTPLHFNYKNLLTPPWPQGAVLTQHLPFHVQFHQLRMSFLPSIHQNQAPVIRPTSKASQSLTFDIDSFFVWGPEAFCLWLCYCVCPACFVVDLVLVYSRLKLQSIHAEPTPLSHPPLHHLPSRVVQDRLPTNQKSLHKMSQSVTRVSYEKSP